jgi:hypothetical protein
MHNTVLTRVRCMKLRFCLFIPLTLLVACGGGGQSSAGATPGDVVSARPQTGLLRRAESEQELADILRAGLQSAYYTEQVFSVMPVAIAEAQTGAPAADSQFSGTNLQEAGVDEADIVKYDGEIIYYLGYESDAEIQAGIAAESTFFQPELSVRLYRTDTEKPEAELVSELKTGSGNLAAEGLYLHSNGEDKNLWAISHSYQYYSWDSFAYPGAWSDVVTRAQSWQVADPELPQKQIEIEIDGSLLASRRIGDRLYLATRFSPTITGITPYPEPAQLDSNKALIADLPTQQLLPQIQVDGVSYSLLEGADCHVPNEEPADGVALSADSSLITVTSIDLTNPSEIVSTCLNVYASGFYASTESIYVTANNSAGNTLVHKIALTGEGPKYRGSGSVPGYIGTSNPAFLMSEHEGDLRVISSVWRSTPFPLPVLELDFEQEAAVEEAEEDLGEHRLTILRESNDGQTLEQVAQLPNANRPDHIGKPNERVYAARFIDERAYVVTFEVIDPLYVLDLSDPEDPVISGELELPGFSTLLQPVGNNLLFGIGHEVPADGPGITQGLKLALFDVSNLEQPQLLAQDIVGGRGSSSPALYDHHALTLLQVEDKFRIALPIERYAEAPAGELGDPWQYYGWSDNGLHLYEIDPQAGSLQSAGQLLIEQGSSEQTWSTGLYESRSILHDEAVFFLNQGEIWSHTWGASTP